ncbi:MAG TPA: hypothetical protein VEN29_19500 [Casimicrobiaceae bacterium]|nr:hypothetical protein [Casimicrobiaceae bacterium]
MPQGAGIGIWAGVAAATFWLPRWLPWAIPLAIVIAVSLWDDRRGVSVPLRLATHAAAAIAWIGWSGGFAGPVPTLIMVLAIVWMTNLYNFMDGSDGLAASMSLIGYGAFALAGWRAGAAETPLMIAVAAATVPFLLVNLPPARAFLGDVGAVPLGFLAAILGIGGWEAQWWPAWFPVLVFLPFVGDATVTLLRRVFAGSRVWEAHRDHYYQRLVRMGLGHSGALALYAALMLGTAGSALAALTRAPEAGYALLALWTAALLLLFASIGYDWRFLDREPDATEG